MKQLPPYKRARLKYPSGRYSSGFRSNYAYKKARKESDLWSFFHSRVAISRYEGRRLHRDPMIFRLYYEAFVRGRPNGNEPRSKRQREYFKRYLLLTGYIESEDIYNEYYP